MNSDLSDIATALTGSIAADGQTPITGAFKLGNGTATAPSYSFSANTNDGIYHPATGQVGIAVGGVGVVTVSTAGITGVSGTAFLPVGTIWDYAGSTAPTGWFLCAGQAISRTTYVELFTVISTTYGTGDGSTTFNIPDLRGRSTFGKDNMGGVAANRITTAGSGVDGLTLGAVGGNEFGQAHSHTGTTGTESATHTHTAAAAVVSAPTGLQSGTNTNLSGTVTTSTESATHTHSFTSDVAGLGNSQNMPPAIVISKIIFAGHP